MAIAALAAVTLLLFAGLALDVGSVWSSRGQSQHVADAVALAAAGEIVDGSGEVTTDSLSGSRVTAASFASRNATIANPAIALAAGDVRFGRWDTCDGVPSFTSVPSAAQVNAVQVDVRLGGGGANAAPPTFFSGLLGGMGFDGFEVTSTATAYLGYEGAVPPGDFDLPLAISSCNALGDTYSCCEPDFCAAIGGSVLEPCADDPTETCLAPELENACWTGFHAAVSEGTLADRVNSGRANPKRVEVGDDLELVADPMVEPMEALRLMVPPSAPPGTFLVVKLPVVGCASGSGNPCLAGSLPATGSICFRVERFVDVPGTPGQIAGHFLCPGDTDFSECRPSGGAPREAGGCNYGVAADRPVLVQ